MSVEQNLIEIIYDMVLSSLKPEDTLLEVSKIIFAYKELKSHKVI